jgi:hypothetical protein
MHSRQALYYWGRYIPKPNKIWFKYTHIQRKSKENDKLWKTSNLPKEFVVFGREKTTKLIEKNEQNMKTDLVGKKFTSHREMWKNI